jgi:O-antigen chain-terminating methyltransferase
VKQQQRHYVPLFAGCDEVLDLGCGRGEFLEVMREAGINAYGVDLSEECVALCADKDLRAEKADLFAHLEARLDSSLGGIFCAQVVEHLPPLRIPELVRLAAAKLHRDGLLIVETPNPECLAIFATHFYIDPTHVRPVPAALLSFYMEEAGLGRIQVSQVAPAAESMPALAALPSEVRDAFFNGLDYYIAGYKL